MIGGLSGNLLAKNKVSSPDVKDRNPARGKFAEYNEKIAGETCFDGGELALAGPRC